MRDLIIIDDPFTKKKKDPSSFFNQIEKRLSESVKPIFINARLHKYDKGPPLNIKKGEYPHLHIPLKITQ